MAHVANFQPPQNIYALQIYPRNSTNAPRLLTQLNELLASKQREAEKAACSLGPSQRCQAAAANLQLEVHRQLFDAFIAGFASYSPLLLQIKVGTQGSCIVTMSNMLRPWICITRNMDCSRPGKSGLPTAPSELGPA